MSDNLQPYGTQDTAPPSEPETREEQYLSAIAGVTAATDIPEKPLTRVEKYLNKIVENGGGGGGTSDYTDLSNKPKINNVELSGNKSSADLSLQDKIDSNNKLAGSLSVLTGYTPGTSTSHRDIAATDTVNEAIQKLENNSALDETNISSIQSHIVFSANSKTYYLQPEQPSNPQDGDIWIG